ncbi:MAG: pyridoxamine 5'-phosphate oxidase [Alphaproteobacteria bacterium]
MFDNKNPIDVFKMWLDEATKTEINDPNAMAIATVDEKGIPQNRMVLLKDIVGEDLVFYTNKNSQKAKAMKANKNVAVLFHWKTLSRQVRITGVVEFADKDNDQKYFSSRSTMSRLGAIASKQSQVLADKKILIDKVDELKKEYSDLEDKKIPCPEYWGGYKIKPNKVELWMDGENRLHDRFEYTKDKNNNWVGSRLYP